MLLRRQLDQNVDHNQCFTASKKRRKKSSQSELFWLVLLDIKPTLVGFITSPSLLVFCGAGGLCLKSMCISLVFLTFSCRYAASHRFHTVQGKMSRFSLIFNFSSFLTFNYLIYGVRFSHIHRQD